MFASFRKKKTMETRIIKNIFNKMKKDIGMLTQKACEQG